MIDKIAEMLGIARKKNKKQKFTHGTGGSKTEKNTSNIQPGSVYRTGGRARQLREMAD